MMKHLELALTMALASSVAASIQPVAATQEVDATLHWARRVELGMLVSGVVQEVTAGNGEHVLAGQALVILDARDFEARLAGAMAHLAGVLPALEEAREELVRAEDLYDRTLLSEHDLELSRVAVAKLKAERAHADARVARATLRLERGTLRAPFAGIVVARSVEAGQAIVSRCESRTLMVLAGDENLIARVALDAQSLAGLRIGQELAVLAGDLTLTGKIAAIAAEPLADLDDGPRYLVEVLVPRPANGGLLVGQGVRLKLP
ncbi:MAG: efflux RND transporter periplasmic adaptor subunit [Gammaproteobacteria bacterium]